MLHLNHHLKQNWGSFSQRREADIQVLLINELFNASWGALFYLAFGDLHTPRVYKLLSPFYC